MSTARARADHALARGVVLSLVAHTLAIGAVVLTAPVREIRLQLIDIAIARNLPATAAQSTPAAARDSDHKVLFDPPAVATVAPSIDMPDRLPDPVPAADHRPVAPPAALPVIGGSAPNVRPANGRSIALARPRAKPVAARAPAAAPMQPRSAISAVATQPAMPSATSRFAAAAMAPSVAPPAPLDDDGVNRKPAYPLIARRRGHEGTVIVRARVDPSGLAARVQIVAGSNHASLDRAAAAAVAGWRFRPAERAGQVVAGSIDVPIIFQLRAPSAVTQTEGTGIFLDFARMVSADFVQMKGLGSSLCWSI